MVDLKEREMNKILSELVKNLDISDTADTYIRESYKAVGEWLSKPESPLYEFDVDIRPQGSYRLGTTIKPIDPNDDIDVDLVCELKGKLTNWTQRDVKQAVGARIKANETYKKMLDEEGRRCWTLLYREDSDQGHYHMDILPSIIDREYNDRVTKMLREAKADKYDWDDVAIRITDRKSENYTTSTNEFEWLKSNPFGYAQWFKLRCQYNQKRSFSVFNESVQPLPAKNAPKMPLQKVVQLLKRHRDVYYGGDEDKPISIIITTLAAKAYSGEEDLVSALKRITNNMEGYIKVKYSEKYGKEIKVIENPVNPEENFADKWPEHPRKEEVFYDWLRQLNQDVQKLLISDMPEVIEILKSCFGADVTKKTFSKFANDTKDGIKSGKTRMTSTGLLSSTGNISINASHNFYGSDD